MALTGEFHMAKRFTKVGTWRDWRTWINAIERFDDKYGVKEGSVSQQRGKYFVVFCLGVSAAAFLIDFLK